MVEPYFWEKEMTKELEEAYIEHEKKVWGIS